MAGRVLHDNACALEVLAEHHLLKRIIDQVRDRLPLDARVANLEAEVARLANVEAEHNRWRQVEPVVTALLDLDDADRTRILSTDQGQYAVGTTNSATRDAWVARVLQRLPAGARLLDAGAGECQYKVHCGHLDYVAQDVAVYDGSGGVGLQNPGWSFAQIDLVCDIVAIPAPDASFDAVLCTEVFEHLPDPVRALDELARLLRPGGEIILTAPFWSLTHQAPFHFATGFNRFFYEHHLGRLGFDILEMTPNGNFFECIGQETRRIRDMMERFTDAKPTALETYAMQVILGMAQRLSARDGGSAEMLHYDFQVRAAKRLSA